MIITLDNIDTLAWQKMENLIPAIVQDSGTGAILMQGFMNQDALKSTLETQKATFFSRSKQRLWLKGETSGNTLNVVQVLTDCDADSILVTVVPQGPTCHLGTRSCFKEEALTNQNFLSYLERVIEERKQDTPEESYTARLMAKGLNKVAQKVGEEGVEVALAAVSETKEDLLGECADLLYHTLVLLNYKDIKLNEVMAVLEQRHVK